MNGYGLQTYGARRYMHPLCSAPEQSDSVSVYEAHAYLEADVNQIEFDHGAAGTLPDAYGDMPAAAGLACANIPGIGGIELVDGEWYPSVPAYSDEARTWAPTGYTSLSVAASTGWPYTIELRDANWTSRGFVTGYLRGNVEIELGRPSSFTLEIDGAHARAASITAGTRVVVRNARRFVIDVFEVGKIEKQRDGDAIYLHVSGQSQAVLLEREAVTTYSTPYTDTEDATTGKTTRTRHYSTVREVVQDLLDFQEQNSFYLAQLDAAIGDRQIIWSCDGTSILGALSQLQSHLPVHLRGHMWVDYKRGLHWILGVTGPVVDIDVGEHLTGLSLVTDYDDIITRLYPQGRELDDGTRLALAAPGYIERNTALYGVRAVSKTDNRILYSESLEAWGEGVLDEFSVPRVTLRVDVIAARLGGLDSRDLTVGSRYRILDSAQSISEVTAVQRISHDLTDPLSLELDVSNRRTTIGDLFKRLAEQMNEEPVQELTRENLRSVLGRTWSDMATRPTKAFNASLADDIFGGAGSSETQSVTTANDSGDSNYAARADHAHQGVTATDVDDAIDDAIDDIDVPVAGAGVLAVGVANSDGVSGDFARVDHVHRGIYTAASSALLPSSVEAWALGFVTAGSEQGRWYHRNAANTAWVALNYLD